MTEANLTQEAKCTCGRSLEGDHVFVCSGCHRNPADCRCRGIMHVMGKATTGGLFGQYPVEAIHDPRANTSKGPGR